MQSQLREPLKIHTPGVGNFVVFFSAFNIVRFYYAHENNTLGSSVRLRVSDEEHLSVWIRFNMYYVVMSEMFWGRKEQDDQIEKKRELGVVVSMKQLNQD